METTKSLCILTLVLAVAVFAIAGSSIAAGDESGAPFGRFQFHYGPFGPGAKVMGQAPVGGIVLPDKAQGATRQVLAPEKAHGIVDKSTLTNQ